MRRDALRTPHQTEPTLTAEQRAWREYLDWTRGAIPSQYDLTEQRAWERLERAVPTLAELIEIPDAPPSNDPVPRA